MKGCPSRRPNAAPSASAAAERRRRSVVRRQDRGVASMPGMCAPEAGGVRKAPERMPKEPGFIRAFGRRIPAMWKMAVPWWELVVRGIAVYAFLLLILRISGKRQVGQLAPFDLVLLLVLANAVQNSMNAGDNSLVGGLITATTLIVLNYLVSLTTHRNKTLEAVIEGRPQILIHNGKLFEDVMT